MLKTMLKMLKSHVKSAVLQIDLYKKQVKVEIHVVQSRIVVSQ